MKNKILLTAVVLLVLNWLNSFSQNFPNSEEFDIQTIKQLQLKSNVKSIATSKYNLEIEFNNIETGDFQSKTSLLFNTGGLIKKNSNESLNENLSSDYFYNSAGLLFKIKHSSGEIIVNKYNENNEISEQYSYDNEGKLIYLIKNIFNVQGRKIETLKLNGYDSEIKEKTIYKYSSRGNLISSEKSIFSEISKKILKKIISNFNQQGLIVELINDDCVTENEAEIFIDESPYKLGDKINLELGTHLLSVRHTPEGGIAYNSETEFQVVKEDKEIIVNSCEGL